MLMPGQAPRAIELLTEPVAVVPRNHRLLLPNNVSMASQPTTSSAYQSHTTTPSSCPGQPALPDSDIPDFPCNACDSVTHKKKTFLKHVKDKHMEHKIRQCMECGLECWTVAAFNDHLATGHRNIPWKTKERRPLVDEHYGDTIADRDDYLDRCWSRFSVPGGRDLEQKWLPKLRKIVVHHGQTTWLDLASRNFGIEFGWPLVYLEMQKQKEACKEFYTITTVFSATPKLTRRPWDEPALCFIDQYFHDLLRLGQRHHGHNRLCTAPPGTAYLIYTAKSGNILYPYWVDGNGECIQMAIAPPQGFVDRP